MTSPTLVSCPRCRVLMGPRLLITAVCTRCEEAEKRAYVEDGAAGRYDSRPFADWHTFTAYGRGREAGLS